MGCKVKLKIIVSCLLIALGAGLMYQFGPRRVEVTEKTVTKDKIVTVVKEIKRPDGTIERDERTERDTDVVADRPVIQPKPDWLVGVSANPFKQGHYQGELSRRVLGNAYVGVRADTHGNLLLGVTILF